MLYFKQQIVFGLRKTHLLNDHMIEFYQLLIDLLHNETTLKAKIKPNSALISLEVRWASHMTLL